MASRLNTYVWVDDVRYGPDKAPPATIAKKITNPDVWADEPDAGPEVDMPATPVSPADPETTDPDRPKGNASREVWAEYATKVGVEVDGQMSRDDIVSAVDTKAAQDD